MLTLPMLINGSIDVVVVVVIVRIIPANPKPLFNGYDFAVTLKNKDGNNEVVLKLQTPF